MTARPPHRSVRRPARGHVAEQRDLGRQDPAARHGGAAVGLISVREKAPMKVLVIYERRTGELVALMRPTGPAPLESRDGHPEQMALPLPGRVAAELEVPSEHADRDLLEIAARYRVAV